MLYYGNAQNIQTDYVVFNFTSLIEGYRRLDLIPPNNLGATSEYEFDVKYMQWIIGDNYRFCEMFQIVYLLNSGVDVYLITSDENWCENLVESLLKLIQQRYGYNATKVNCFDDILSANGTDIDPRYGLINYDEDLERYDYIQTAIRMSGGQKCC